MKNMSVKINIPNIPLRMSSCMIPISFFLAGGLIHQYATHNFIATMIIGVPLGVLTNYCCRYIAQSYIVDMIKAGKQVTLDKAE